LAKTVREAENSIAASNKPVKARKLDAFDDAVNAAEDYLIEKALVKTVPATNAAGKVKEMVVNKAKEAKKENIDNNNQEEQSPIISPANSSSMPSLKGLNKYVSALKKNYGDQIESIMYNVETKNSVGISIQWKNDRGSTAFSFDNRFKTHTLPSPPPLSK
jgi:hypothetical protein